MKKLFGIGVLLATSCILNSEVMGVEVISNDDYDIRVETEEKMDLVEMRQPSKYVVLNPQGANIYDGGADPKRSPVLWHAPQGTILETTGPFYVAYQYKEGREVGKAYYHQVKVPGLYFIVPGIPQLGDVDSTDIGPAN